MLISGLKFGAFVATLALGLPVSAALYSLQESIVDVAGSVTSSLHYSSFGSFGLQFGTNSASSDYFIVPGFARSSNEPPQAGVSYFARLPGQTLTIPISSLLAKTTDLEGDQVQFLASDPATRQGVPLLLQGQNLIYSSTSSVPNADQFSYSVSDAAGFVATGVVLVNTGGTFLTILDPSAVFWLQFTGPPLQTYRIEATDQLAPPVWQVKGSVSIDSFGNGLFRDGTGPGHPHRYYRAVLP